ncbi:MAG: PfkB family carbohydrate kinase [Streptosporangiales bacterium]
MTGAGLSVGRVVVVGSINVDLVAQVPRLPRAGETVTGGVFARHQGGKGANQAVAAARAGGEVVMVGAVGPEDEGALPDLQSEGVDTGAVARIPDAWTGRALIVVADDGENQIAVASGANHQLDPAHVHDRLEGLTLTDRDVVVLSYELLDAPLLAAAKAAVSTGARLVVNPAPARPADVLRTPRALVTPNRSELAELVGLPTRTDGELRDAAAALVEGTSGTAATTLGADGVLLADGTCVEHLPAFTAEVRDTTGAGDTLTGVLAASLATGQDLRGSVRRAMAAAALAVTRAGARDGMPSATRIDDFLRDTR